MPQFMLISWRIGPLTTTIADAELTTTSAHDRPRRRQRQNDREIFRPRARHHGVDRDLLDREFPGAADCGRLHMADDLVRLVAGAGQHLGDALFGRQHDRQVVGPVIFQELCRFSSVSGSTRRGVELGRARALGSFGVPRCQTFDHLLHHRLAGDRVLAFDIGPQFVGGLAHHRLRHEGARRIGQALPSWYDRTTRSNMSVCSATVGTPYLVSTVIAWVVTAGAQVLQWPTPTMAASPFALISSQVFGSSCR